MQKRTLAHLSKRVFNTPLFVTQDGLAPIANYMSDPERTLKLMQYEKDVVEDKQLLRSDFKSDDAYRKYQLESMGVNPETMVGTIDVKGTLVNRAGQTQACVELTSYESLKRQFTSQIENGVKTIVMQIDSHGGEAYRMFGATNAVRKMATDNDVKIIAYVDGTSASAGYGWASIADEIIANPQSRIGSVGVVIQLYNDTKYLEKVGIERSFVYAGKNKIPFADDGSFSEDFIADLQKGVNRSYNTFTKFIATNRNLTVEQVVETNAKVYDAEEALSVGFIDKIMEIEEFEEYMNTEVSQTTIPNGDKMSTKLDGSDNAPVTDLTEVETLQAQLTTLQGDLDNSKTELTTALTANTDLQSKFDALVETNKTLSDKIAKIEADAITADRKEKLESVLGTENPQVFTLLTTTESLDDAQFTAIVGALQTKVDVEDESMVEVGDNANQKAEVPSYVDTLKQTLKNRK